jgi:dihydrofolate synthase/folylpolyglutamate synthase
MSCVIPSFEPAPEGFAGLIQRRSPAGIEPSLDGIRALLEAVGNPQDTFPAVHVAGTNGKGSVCAMIESVLREAGLNTGLYTSPHLFRLNERFRICGQPVDDQTLSVLLGKMEQTAERLEHDGLRRLTFFEITTAAAFEYFARQSVDLAVIETGMGGRWDATNLIQPLLSVITRIDYDHAAFLGSDLDGIAAEKAGIIKPGRPVVTAAMPPVALEVIGRCAAECGAPLLRAEDQVSVQRMAPSARGQKLRIETAEQVYAPVRLPLHGRFQLENCAVAVTALELLGTLTGRALPIREGLEKTDWPGRMQYLCDQPPLIFDVAHNPGAAAALAAELQQRFKDFEIGVLFGFLNDKAAAEFLTALKPVGTRWWGVPPDSPRALAGPALRQAAQAAGVEADWPETVPAAARAATDWVGGAEKRMLCVTGSFCCGPLAAAVRALLCT